MNDLSFGRWLKRKTQGTRYTQAELQASVFAARQPSCKLEAEERRPSAQIAERLAEIFKSLKIVEWNSCNFARGDWRSALAKH